MNPETRIEKSFLLWCKKNKIPCLKLVSLGLKGFPDRTVFLEGGKIVFIEFKSESGKLSKNQEMTFSVLRKLGFAVFVCRSKDEAISAIQSTLISKIGDK